ncbi:MAG: GGDEF domain-containing protein, partial [Desulfuromonadales bacterium]|nr:GGDEF domain-containing protein [Desulfuromonadales bacterium]
LILHMQQIHGSAEIAEIVREISICLKDVLNYELFGFALQESSSLHVWVDPRSYGNAISATIEADFPSHNIDEIYYFDDSNATAGQGAPISGDALQSYRLVDKEWTAVLYILSKTKNSPHHREAVEIILEAARVVLGKSLMIKRLESDAALDHLTGCFNRRTLEKCLDHDIAVAQRYDGAMSIMILDVDYFKRINDSHGHLAGDSVLKEIAEFLRGIIRRSDYLARYGGEEFVICLPNTQLQYAARLAENIRTALQNHPICLGDRKVPVTASFGVAALSRGSDQEKLLAEADKMLYHAKATGRNRVCVSGLDDDLSGKILESLWVMSRDMPDTAVMAKQ